MRTTELLATASLLAYASGAAIVSPRGDPIYDSPTCGIGGRDHFLGPDMDNAVEEFALYVEGGADGRLDMMGNFKGTLSRDVGGVTVYACDYKKHGRGSVINADLIRGALGVDQYLDKQCKRSNAGYESSNDLAIGRTYKGDSFC